MLDTIQSYLPIEWRRTAEFLGALFSEHDQGGIRQTSTGIRYRRILALGVAIRMPHPQASRNARQSYERLAAAISQILGAGERDA